MGNIYHTGVWVSDRNYEDVYKRQGFLRTWMVTVCDSPSSAEDAVTVTSCPVVVADFVMQLSCFAVPGVSVGVCSFPVIICVHFAVTTVDVYKRQDLFRSP